MARYKWNPALTRRLRHAVLPAVVFLTGACVLVIEVAATRVLSPYFGNTIYSYSSILGVVLAALSIGYYFGGRLADKRPSPKLFYGIIAAGGASVLLLHLLTITLLPWLSRHLSIISGPLVSSLALFLLPAILLGTLSPFAIKLQQTAASEKGIGTIAGEMFFWSTLGSIAGSLSTGFILTPLFGVDAIILGTGVFLITLGLLPLMLLNKGRRFRAISSAALVIAMILAIQAPTAAGILAARQGVLYSQDGVYERLLVYDGEFKGRPARYFQQDRSNSGAMYLDSDELVYEYTKYYSLYKLTNPDVRDALVIGGGAYSIPKAIMKDLPQAKVTVSEIEPSLYDLGKKYFNVKDSPKLINSTEDGRRLLANSPSGYDLIFSDVYYSLYSIPHHFTTQEFFRLAHDRLNDDGIFIANLIGTMDRDKPSLFLSEMRTFQTAFPNSYFFAARSPYASGTQNIMFVGIKGDKKLDLTSPEITGSSDAVIRNLAAKAVDPARFNLKEHAILTDNYSPVEHFTAPLLARRHDGSQPDGQAMMELIRQQLAYGPRHVGAPGHEDLARFIEAEARSISPATSVQKWREKDTDGKEYGLKNIVMRLQPDNPRRIILGAHYDSKRTANLDPKDKQAAMPGANDAGSGVAVLLETAKVLAASDEQLPVGIDFVFFDAEEGLPNLGTESGGWRPVGSQYFAANLSQYYPERLAEGGVVVDMVCDKDLGIHQDLASLQYAPSQTRKFWEIGNRITPGAFLPDNGLTISDDHTALNEAGIPSFDVIDFDYPPFHTTGDTLDKCSPDSLTTVSRTVLEYLRSIR